MKVFLRFVPAAFAAIIALSGTVMASPGSAVIRIVLNGAVADEALNVEMCGEDVLLPLPAMGRLLGMTVSWDPKARRGGWVRWSDGAECEYQIGTDVLSINGAGRRMTPAAVIAGGIPFVPCEAVEEGMDCTLDWNFAEQALYLRCSRVPSPGNASLSTGNTPALPARSGEARGIIGAEFSLVHDSTEGTKWQLGLRGSAQALGYPVTWRLALGTPEPGDDWGVIQSLGISIRGEWSEVVLGDSLYAIPFLVPATSIRGLRVSLPPGRIGDSGTPAVDLSGPAPNDSSARLFINGHLYSEYRVRNGEWRFEHIPLSLIAPTTIRIEITSPLGQVTVIERELAAAARLESAGGFSQSSALGLIGGPPGDRWNRALLGVDTRYGITGDLTAVFSAGASWNVGLGDAHPQQISGTVSGGVIWRLCDPLIASVDFLASGYRDPSFVPDTGWRLGLQYARPGLGVRGTLFHYGPEFRLPGDESPRNKEGIILAASMTPAANLSLSADYQVERAVEPDGSDTISQLGLTGAWHAGVFGAITASGRWWNAPSAGSSGDRMDLAIGFDHHSAFMDLGATWRGLWWDDSGTPVRRNDFALALTGRLAGTLTERLRAELQLSEEWVHCELASLLIWQYSPQALFTLLSTYEAPDYDHFLAPGANVLYGGVNLQYTWAETRLTAESETGFSLAFQESGPTEWIPRFKLGVRYESPDGFRIWASGQVDAGTATYYAFKIGLSQALAFDGARFLLIPSNAALDGGLIAGVAFDDLNGNGVRDAGEPALRGCPVQLGQYRLRTGLGGVYSFIGLAAGDYWLGIDEARLDMRYRVTTPAIAVQMSPGGRLSYDFGVALNGTVTGRVFIDSNRNGVYDAGDSPLAGAFMMVNGRWVDTCTDEEGIYVLEGFLPGEYQITVDPTSLPEGVSLFGLTPAGVTLTREKWEFCDCDLALALAE